MKNKYIILSVLALACYLGSGMIAKQPPYTSIDVTAAQIRKTPAEQIPDYSKFAENKEWTKDKIKWVDSVIAAEKQNIVESKKIVE